jgi:tetratricopeptide (TPR) repeat protein
MDALKKAEEEKKQAAKRLQEVEVETREVSGENNVTRDKQIAEEESTEPKILSETAQLSLEPISLNEKFDDTKEEVLVDDSHNEREVPTVDESEAFSEDITLENTVASGLELEKDQELFEETQKVIDLNDTTIIEGLSSEIASAPFDDTFHGVLFEEEQDTAVYEETLPGVPADQLVKDLGGGEFQPTPVAAKTVFSTGRPSKKNSSFKWSIFIALAILATASFAIFYYFTITPVSRKLPSPLIARGIESNIAAPPIISSPPESGIIISPVVEQEQAEVVEVEIEDPAISNEMNANLDEALAEDDKQAVVEEAKPAAADQNILEEVISIDETENNIAVEEINEANIEESLEKQPIENIQVEPSLISITKSKATKKVNVMVTEAFNAYKEGHYDAAKSIYIGVLKDDPDNRDAHLGLAAIAISNQDRKNAYTHYVHLLELNPDDALALNALIGLSNSADPVKDESAIKLLIQREGDMPYLYFSLGNIYAKQQRWANAQQAFFDAYRLDTANPDYVLNLAVSLDQIGQYETALDFYKTAIDLSQNSPTRLDFAPIKNRILVLSKLVESKS